VQSWVNIAIMSERLGVNVWSRGLGEGWSIKDAFDQNRPYFESLGLTWVANQVGIRRVRIAGQLVPPMYVGYRLQDRVNSGPVEYIQLYTTIWPTFTTAGSQVCSSSDAPQQQLLSTQPQLLEYLHRKLVH
jgi:hypothetical protein